MADYQIAELTEDHARQILDWRYPAPYDFYNPPIPAHDAADQALQDRYVEEFLNPDNGFHAVLDGDQQLAGFCSYGHDGQVPGGDYAAPALDIGLGMRPELTGQGRGRAFFEAIVAYGADHYRAARLRLTVADFNHRAMALYGRFGFRVGARFQALSSHTSYTILNLDLNLDVRL
jgi:ribosomal-protein-alanine N-acetyltransferase